VPTLERLLAGRHPVVVVVSQPDRPRGRGRKRTPSPVAEVALRENLPLLRPESVGEASVAEALRSHAPDLGVVVAFGQFIPKRVRELPTLGYCINGHASLLPRYRGAAPIARALLGGESRTGVSVMRVEREMDAGPVALTRDLAIGPEESRGELEERLARLTAEAVAEGVERAAQGRIHWQEQDPDRATLAPKLEPGEARIDWSEPCEAVARRVRAFAPTPGAVTGLDGQPLRILAARAQPGAVDRPPGVVRVGPDGALSVACSDGWLLPTRVQRAGGRAMDVADFLRGRAIPDGTKLGRREADDRRPTRSEAKPSEGPGPERE
jgi:methionyl-tRNA formyltransferase